MNLKNRFEHAIKRWQLLDGKDASTLAERLENIFKKKRKFDKMTDCEYCGALQEEGCICDEIRKYEA
jgi:hypothetical protein